MDIVVAGGSGFIGHRLVPVLREAGHDVRALSRHPEDELDPGEPGWGSLRHVAGDVMDAESLAEPFAGADVLIYLVHSLGDDDFERRDAEAAWAVAAAAKTAGISRIVYLGGLGDEDMAELSTHLRSRREVEGLLGATGIPVTVLRAGIIVGNGSISWEITRQLVTRMPIMIAPTWVSTRSQPIAVDDVVGYLLGVVEEPATAGVTYDIGGPDVLTYQEMMEQSAKVMGRVRPRIIPLPIISTWLSGKGLRVLTDVDPATAEALVESMVNEVVVRDDSITHVLPRRLLTFAEAVEVALADRAEGRVSASPDTRKQPT